ncbi:hypothetical protein OIY81_2703 [Cryptosporidium canis]|nr:hypothetical protein OIY81_2703 [Cryptosporidium canis]
MRQPRERIQLLASAGMRSLSDDELPIVTPCSAPYLSSAPKGSVIPDSLMKSCPSIKVYSEQDETYVIFHVRSAETTVADLKDFISSLRDGKRAHNSSLDSQASTMDSSLNSYREQPSGDMSISGQNIRVYGYIPGLPKRTLSDSDTILREINGGDGLKLYYSVDSTKHRDSSLLKVTVYPKANLYELGINCSIVISESGLKFTPEQGEGQSKKIIFISFDDISSISVYRQIENCLLLKRRTIGKNSFLIRASSCSDFDLIKKRLKQVSEIQRDTKLISDADSRLLLCNMRPTSTESLTSSNALITYFELTKSSLGRKIFSEWTELMSKNSNSPGDHEAHFNKLVTFDYIKQKLLNQDYSLSDEDQEFSNMLVKFESYLMETISSVEDLLLVN